MLKRLGFTLLFALFAASTIAAPAVAGKWALLAKGTPHGDMEMQLSIAQQARSNKITGELTIASSTVPMEGETTGEGFTLKGGHHDMQLTVTGKLKSDGTLEGFLSSERGDLTWTGKRTK